MIKTPLIVGVTALPGAQGGPATAAAVGVAMARAGAGEPRGVVVLLCGENNRRRPTLVSSGAARSLESSLGPDLPTAARGALCIGSVGEEDDVQSALAHCGETGAAGVVIFAPPAIWRDLVDGGEVAGAVLRSEPEALRPLTAVAARELIAAGVRTAVVPRAPGPVASRRALAGIEPGGDLGARAGSFAKRLFRSQVGQATPIALFFVLAAIVAGVLVAVLGAAATGASRQQTATDLAAVSAARSMRDDYFRLFLPPRLPGGLPNPAHLSEARYRSRATQAAREIAEANGARVPARVTFPGALFAPTRVRVELDASPEVEGVDSDDEVRTVAVAEAYPIVAPTTTSPAAASGGGYSGPLASRQGEGMRPDVARAFDAMAAAAARDGVALIINSGFRSDAEQAALFAANPDPRMVARPGTSLHRCGTELDLGPSGAYGWLAANAQRFGFLQRYSWEPWHYGFVRGPEPCSAAANAGLANRADGAGAEPSLPSFVPERFRDAISRAASRWNVPGSVLAAQLLSESNFNPLAVSPAGAGGIAQFMPATAAAYGLKDRFDPDSAIDAQAHLMSDLLGQFGDVSLALAAYNAGPAPVASCSCVPPYPETQGYVARILGLLGGVGAAAPPSLEVRLVG